MISRRRLRMLLPMVAGTVSLAAVATAVAFEPTAASILANQPREVVEALDRDKTVVLQRLGGAASEQTGFIVALVVFERPASRVMRLLSQTTRQQEFRPELRSVEAIQHYEDGVLDEHRLRIMFVNMVYRLRNHYDFQARRIWWELDPNFDNDVEDIEGYWELYDYRDGETLGRFGVRIDIGKALPVALQNLITSQKVPKLIENTRRWVNSDGVFRP